MAEKKSILKTFKAKNEIFLALAHHSKLAPKEKPLLVYRNTCFILDLIIYRCLFDGTKRFTQSRCISVLGQILVIFKRKKSMFLPRCCTFEHRWFLPRNRAHRCISADEAGFRRRKTRYKRRTSSIATSTNTAVKAALSFYSLSNWD